MRVHVIDVVHAIYSMHACAIPASGPPMWSSTPIRHHQFSYMQGQLLEPLATPVTLSTVRHGSKIRHVHTNCSSG